MRPASLLFATLIATALLGPGAVSAGTDVGNGFSALGFLPAAQFVQVNISSYEDPDLRPAPCHARVAFIDSEGSVLKSGELSVDNGKIRSLHFSAEDLPSVPAGRLLIRAFVVTRLAGAGRTDQLCKVTLEVVDSATGRTTVFFGNPDEFSARLAP